MIIDAIKNYLERIISITETVLQLNVSKDSIEYWALRYITFGAEGLITTSKNNY